MMMMGGRVNNQRPAANAVGWHEILNTLLALVLGFLVGATFQQVLVGNRREADAANTGMAHRLEAPVLLGHNDGQSLEAALLYWPAQADQLLTPGTWRVQIDTRAVEYNARHNRTQPQAGPPRAASARQVLRRTKGADADTGPKTARSGGVR